jgi:TM2 domain-containing membrane protein YozV
MYVVNRAPAPAQSATRGAHFFREDRFSPMATMVGCPHCGASMAKDAAVCTKCGQARGTAPASGPTEFSLMADMSDSQRLLFQTQMTGVRKNPTTGVLLSIFLGGLGAHHFYMGNTLTGLGYVLLCWTLLPAIFSLFEAFAMPARVRRYNLQRAIEIAAQVKALGAGR